MEAKNIILTGFMGSGKTVVGSKLSAHLGLEFLDIDFEIEKFENSSIENIFLKKGEPYFRKRESEVVKKACLLKNVIIATGGGSLLNSDSLDLLKKTGIIIWLYTDIKILKERLASSENRPLLKDPEDIVKLLSQRMKLYQKYDISVDTSFLTIEQVVEEICKRLGMK
jgi:shikimate kinase